MNSRLPFFSFLLFVVVNSFSSTIKIPSDYSTIQAGMDAARDGDTVLISDGTYTGAGNLFLDFAGKAIVVKSENGPENCIIDCVDGTGVKAFLIKNGESRESVVEGLKIINGCWVVFIENSSPTIKNIISENNNSGVYCGENSNPLVEQSIISGSNENGIYCYYSTGIIRNNTISGSNWSGIKCNSSYPIIENNTISNNFYSGISYNNSSGRIQNNSINYNLYNGIYCTENCYPDIGNNIISENAYPGIYCIKSSPNIFRNLIKKNGGRSLASNSYMTYDNHNRFSEVFIGSALHGGISINDSSNSVIQNNIIIQNNGLDVGAIFCDITSSASIINNHILDNSSIYGGCVNVKNSSSKIVNNIIANSQNGDSNNRLSRWYKDNLFARYIYDGAKLENVTYYFGFINNGPPGEVKITGCAGLNTSVWTETGERNWIEARSAVSEFGDGGGLSAIVSLDTSSFQIVYKRPDSSNPFLTHACLAILSPTITSLGITQKGVVGAGIVVMNQDKMPEITYNDIYGNVGGGYAFSDTTETKIYKQFDLTGTDGNISTDPLIDQQSYELINGSPCIDAGAVDTTGLNLGLTDYNGNNRFYDATPTRPATIDIGAFEFQEIFVGIEEYISHGQDEEFCFSILPNPSNGIFNLRINSNTHEVLNIKIINSLGQVKLLRSIDSPAINGFEQFNLSHLSKGIYHFVVTTEESQECRNIVIQ